MAASEIGLRRLASQRIATGRLGRAADVVRWLGAVQAQDYHQALWAIGSRMRSGTARKVERAIEQREIVRTWLLRGTIHFAAPEDIRFLLALCAPRLASTEARRHAQLGLGDADVARSAATLTAALGGDRRLSRPEVMAALEGAGVDTSGQRGYHVLARLARDGLICIGPLQGRQPTFVLLDDWAPRSGSRELAGEQALADIAARFVASRGPVSDRDLARWAGITLTDARRGLHAASAPALVTRTLAGAEYWVVAGRRAPVPRAGRERAYLLAGFDEFVLGYENREAQLAPEHADRVVPGGNGIFRPVVVEGGRVVGTWARTTGAGEADIAIEPFADDAAALAGRAQAEAQRYRAFLGGRP